MTIKCLYFWQQTLSPHLAYLADALAIHYGLEVIYVANSPLTPHRAQMGWLLPTFDCAQYCIAKTNAEIDQVISSAPPGSIHICEGLRGNGLVSYALKQLCSANIKPWIVMETVDDSGLKGVAKRIIYRLLLSKIKLSLSGFLAIGHSTPHWLCRLGANSHDVHPFAYFLPDTEHSLFPGYSSSSSPFTFLFVGQLIRRKQLDLLLMALSTLSEDTLLTVVGDGPMLSSWKDLSSNLLPSRVNWLGSLPMNEIPNMMKNTDCLVLPSRFDGWGAVVSESLMLGTPVICSDSCGSAGVVQSSGFGGVFRSQDLFDLSSLLSKVISTGRLQPSQRSKLSSWAQSLGAKAGAAYLRSIIERNNTTLPYKELFALEDNEH